jgi:hypothetical protein
LSAKEPDVGFLTAAGAEVRAGAATAGLATSIGFDGGALTHPTSSKPNAAAINARRIFVISSFVT